VASSGYWLGNSHALIAGNSMFPNLMAMGLTSSPFIVAIIGIGFILNSFQIVNNCYIGTTRIMVAQGLDGLLPDWFSRINPRFKTPLNAHIAYFVAAVPVIILFNKVADWSTRWALGVTFANGMVFVISALAAALLPYRAKKVYDASPGARYKVGGLPLVTILGGIGFLTAAFMVGAFLFVPGLGLAYSSSAFPYLIGALHGAAGIGDLPRHALGQGPQGDQGAVRLRGDPARVATGLGLARVDGTASSTRLAPAVAPGEVEEVTWPPRTCPTPRGSSSSAAASAARASPTTWRSSGAPTSCCWSARADQRSTFHSAGLVGQLRSSVTLTKMMMYGAELYRTLARDPDLNPGWVQSGGIRLAPPPNAWRSSAARSAGRRRSAWRWRRSRRPRHASCSR
jgi:hypothetical protein